MLHAKKPKKNGGIILWGDEHSLREMREFILDISKKSRVLGSDGLTLGLAYDLGKAYSRRRKISKFNLGNDRITIFGAEQVWPTFLMQVALLRTGLAFADSDKKSQSLMYQLEAIAEDSINCFLGAEAVDILCQYKRLIGIPENFIGGERLGSRVSYFLSLKSNQRKKQLAEVLKSLHIMWEDSHDILGGTLSLDSFKGHSWESVTDDSEL